MTLQELKEKARERDEDILNAHLCGIPVKEMVPAYLVTRSRIYQILKRARRRRAYNGKRED